MKERKIIEKLISEHLISHFQQATSRFKAHYRVTSENLADFIDSYFERRKIKKPWKKVLSDSKK